MTSTNLNIVLTNALCCVSELSAKLSKMYSIGNTCADSELVKLKLLNDYIDTLRCYKIDATNSKFRYKSLYDAAIFRAISNPNRLYVITVNGVEYSAVGDGVKTRFEIIGDILDTIPNIIDYYYWEDPDTSNPRYSYLELEASCDVTEINYSVYIYPIGILNSSLDIAIYQTGVCTPTNCITEDQFNQMVAYVMNACDICECQLNQ